MKIEWAITASLGCLLLVPGLHVSAEDKGAAATSPALSGSWKFNSAQSDDAQKKIAAMEAEQDNAPRAEGGGVQAPTADEIGGNGNTGHLGAGIPGQGGAGGGGRPLQSPLAHQWESDKDRQARTEYLFPAATLTIAQKPNEFDVTDEKGREQALYTDTRELHKPTDKLQEFSAHADAAHLSFEEKRGRAQVVTRTFALSSDGRQLYETVSVDSGTIYAPTEIRYVFDAAAPIGK